MIEDDVDDYWTEKGEAERHEARAEKKAKAAEHLQHCDHIHVAAAHECGDKRPGLAMHLRHGHELEERIRTEDGEHETEQDANDDDDVFHKEWLRDYRSPAANGILNCNLSAPVTRDAIL